MRSPHLDFNSLPEGVIRDRQKRRPCLDTSSPLTIETAGPPFTTTNGSAQEEQQLFANKDPVEFIFVKIALSSSCFTSVSESLPSSHRNAVNTLPLSGEAVFTLHLVLC